MASLTNKTQKLLSTYVMTIETSTKAFEDQILNKAAQVTEVIKHKSPNHQASCCRV
jgi:hypothetical protein